MIYELRQYRIKPGRMEDCHRMFREVILPLFEKLGIESIGYWEPEHKGEFDLHYVVAFDSAEARARLWPEFTAHPDWVAEQARWTDGPPYEMTKSTVMRPTDYSPAG
jgi:hypothetical protein